MRYRKPNQTGHTLRGYSAVGRFSQTSQHLEVGLQYSKPSLCQQTGLHSTSPLDLQPLPYPEHLPEQDNTLQKRRCNARRGARVKTPQQKRLQASSRGLRQRPRPEPRWPRVWVVSNAKKVMALLVWARHGTKGHGMLVSGRAERAKLADLSARGQQPAKALSAAQHGSAGARAALLHIRQARPMSALPCQTATV